MFCPQCLHKLRQDITCSHILSCCPVTGQWLHPCFSPQTHFPLLCYEPRQCNCPQLWPLLTFQALDAIEKAQDLAEEVGNKVRHNCVSWVWGPELKEEKWV